MPFMARLRRYLSQFVTLWLIGQSASLLAAPISLAQLPRSETVLGVEECHCPGVGPGQICPMHHKRRESKETCRMCGTSDAGEVALVVLTVGLGILAPAPAEVAVSHHGESVAVPAASVVARVGHPDSPPPRG
jgi:hypothetical protein